MARRSEQSAGVYIQTIASIIWWMIFLVHVIGAIVLFRVLSYTYYGGGIINCLILLCLGIGLAFWYFLISCLKGFGELVDDTHYIRRSNATIANYIDSIKANNDTEESV